MRLPSLARNRRSDSVKNRYPPSVGLVLGLTLLVTSLLSSADTSIQEARLRASVLVAVLRYTQWGDNNQQPIIHICGTGHSPAFEVLEDADETVQAADKTLRFTAVEALQTTRRCDVLVIGADADSGIVMELLQDKSLSICDTCNDGDLHAVALYIKNQRIRFSVNPQSALTSGVRFSAAMMELADHIVEQ